MGGADTYCLLTGNRYQHGVHTLVDQIRDTWLERIDEIPRPSEELLQKLFYNQEDVQDSKNFVIITPYERMASGDVVVLDGFDHPPPAAPSPHNVTAIFHVVPGNNPDLADYRSSANPNVHYTVSSYGATRIITFSAWRILVGRFPKYHWPSILYSICKHRPAYLEGVQQGPTARIREQFANWVRVADFEEEIARRESDPVEQPSEEEDDWYSDYHKAWYRLLMSKDKTTEQIVEEAWLGKGNMYCFVRPDRSVSWSELLKSLRNLIFAYFSFPVAETHLYPALLKIDATNQPRTLAPLPNLTSLPLDIYHYLCSTFLTPKSVLTLVSLNRHLRSLLLPNVDALVHKCLTKLQPYYLPIADAPCPNGDGEIKWWRDKWKKHDISAGADGREHSNIPWMQYARACSKSTSMKNRKRIWGIVDQVERIARERALLH
uniref:F-box domain-containing protein n=1 Tax=Moniliophthora roreri TaxID=221103 RepID=A0A0W0FZ64_MONRR